MPTPRPTPRLRWQRSSGPARSSENAPVAHAPSSFLKRLGTFSKALLAGAVALAAAISAIAAALYIVAPQLSPREKLGAEIDRVAVSQGVDYSTYKTEQRWNGHASRSPEEPDDPTEMGVVVLVHAKLSGYEDRSYSLRVTAFDAETHKAFPPPSAPSSPDEPGKVMGTCDGKSPKADEDGVAWRCWLISPPRDAEYFLRIELMDNGPTIELVEGPVESTELMDFRDSETLTSLGTAIP